MSKKNFSYDDIINLLIKKANGFYYTEEQLEYEKTQKNIKSISNSSPIYENLSFFENSVRGNDENINNECIIKSSNKRMNVDKDEDLTLVKKKVSSHYVSPDMLAIKILFEIYKEKVDSNEIENMSDDELIKLKDELIKELNNESN